MSITNEQLINAANTIKQYCEEHKSQNPLLCDDTCPIAGACLYMYDLHDIEELMHTMISYAREHHQNTEKDEEE